MLLNEMLSSVGYAFLNQVTCVFSFPLFSDNTAPLWVQDNSKLKERSSVHNH